MEKVNIPGGLMITLLLVALVGYAISRAVDLDWNLFFSVFGSIAVVAIVTSILAMGGDKA